ncbi:MAG: hypothetical protein ACE149_05290 [Armatimonadota bacterium]
MSEGRPSAQQRRFPLSSSVLFAVYAPTLALLALVAIISKRLGVDVEVLLRDPAHLVDVPVYTGLISNLGIAVWCAGAVVALFAAALLPRAGSAGEKRRFLLWSGALTLYLMVDDLAMLHDDVYVKLFHIYEQVVFIAYLPIALLYIIRFRRHLFGPNSALVVLTGIFTALSLTMDQWHMLLTIFGRVIIPESQLIEKGAKLLAMVSWTAFLLVTAADSLRAAGAGALAPDTAPEG